MEGTVWIVLRERQGSRCPSSCQAGGADGCKRHKGAWRQAICALATNSFLSQAFLSGIWKTAAALTVVKKVEKPGFLEELRSSVDT